MLWHGFGYLINRLINAGSWCDSITIVCVITTTIENFSIENRVIDAENNKKHNAGFQLLKGGYIWISKERSL